MSNTNIKPQKLFYFLPLAFLTGPFLPDLICTILSLLGLYELIKRNINPNTIIKILIGFYFLILLSGILSSIELNSSIFYLRFVLFAFYVSIISDPKVIRIFNIIFFIIFIFLFIDGITELITNKNLFGKMRFSEERLSSVFDDELILGSFLSRNFVFILLGLLFLLNESNKKQKIKEIILYSFLFFFLLFIFLTGERVSFFYSLLSVLLYLKYIKKMDNSKIILPIFFFIFCILILYFFNVPSVKRMIELTLTQFFLDNQKISFNFFSTQYEQHFKVSLLMFKENPLLGFGPKSFREICQFYPYNTFENGCSTHPHNIYLQLLSEIGIVGFLIIFCLFLLTIIKFFKSETQPQIKIFLIPIIISLWPLVPTMSFFTNWINVIYFLPIGMVLNKNFHEEVRKVI